MEGLVLLLCALVLALSVRINRAQLCPKRCLCQNLSPSIAILCAKTGLLFVPPFIDRRTVELRLTDNFITTVRRRDFANMTSLVHLTLSRNTISQMAPHSFGDLRGLRALHLDSNRLTRLVDAHLRGLVNLRHLILNNNQLHAVSDGSFEDFLGSLEDLDMSYNNLETFPWEAISKMVNLNTLSLDHNLIDHIEEGTFSVLHKLSRLDMTSNRLHKLPPDPLFLRTQLLVNARGSHSFLLVLSFGGNPLHCNCELLWLRRLMREDDLETCASPPHLMGKYFWSIAEEEFVCEPPLITRLQATKAFVVEGQGVTLKCKAVGDPDPSILWSLPEGKLVSNNSRTIIYDNGTLDILITTLKDNGRFSCIASNAAGESATNITIGIIPLPHFVNLTQRIKVPDPGSSDISTSSKPGAPSNSSEAKSAQDKKVTASELTTTSALVRWPSQRSIPGIRMFQIQYNSSSDNTLVYRMIPSTSRLFLVNDLAPGRDYELCVLAVYDDGMTALTATRVVGCVRFTTEQEYTQCHSVHTQFLGGTMIIIIGGIIVASVLVFIIILMIRYKVYSGSGGGGGGGGGGGLTNGGKASGTNVYSQTNGNGNGSHNGALDRSCSKPEGPGESKSPEMLVDLPDRSQTFVLSVTCEQAGGARTITSAVSSVPVSSSAVPASPTGGALPQAQRLRANTGAGTRAPPAANRQLSPRPSPPKGGRMEASNSATDANTDDADSGTSVFLISSIRGKPAKLGDASLLPCQVPRAQHRHSFDGDYSLFQSHSYPRRTRTKRSLTSSGQQLHGEDRKGVFSSTEWMLESTV